MVSSSIGRGQVVHHRITGKGDEIAADDQLELLSHTYLNRIRKQLVVSHLSVPHVNSNSTIHGKHQKSEQSHCDIPENTAKPRLALPVK